MPDIELASPTTFFWSGYRWASYLLAPVLHCSVPQLPCAVAPSYTCQLCISLLVEIFDNDAITFRSRSKDCASRRGHQLVGQGVQEGVQHSQSTRCRYTGQFKANIADLTRTGCAGIAELMVFHPVDTTAKRLMSNIGKVRHVDENAPRRPLTRVPAD
jgi:hypothetical protein